MTRKFPIGAELQPGGGVHFRVWAPASSTAAIEWYDTNLSASKVFPLQGESAAPGYFSGSIVELSAGARYKIKLQSGSFPDPVSRFQPEGPHGPSEIVAPQFAWTDAGWRGRAIKDLVIYELHLGTFTSAGTWRSAMAELPELARIGITLIEIMPISEFPGKFGWGYDGVDHFAPCHLYGSPDDARAFVDRAHALGLMVILDVVYNHFGPNGNYLRPYADAYFTPRYSCEWGDAINFDGENSAPVREFFLSNARYWIDEFHFDGLRLDATQQMFDRSPVHILKEIAQAARAAAGSRQIYLVGENEVQHGQLVRGHDRHGYGLDALWNDDFYHSIHVVATGQAEGYRGDYRGTPQELISALKYGFLYQGQWFDWQKKRRGLPAFDLAAHQFVVFLQNHDQVANSLRGLRLHELTSPGKFRALTALTLLAPATPMLFQGQEFAASSPFVYFADHDPELNAKVADGRRSFLHQFPSIAAAEETGRGQPPDPSSVATFQRCKLDFSERTRHAAVYRLHEDLLRLRRSDPAIGATEAIDGAVLGSAALVLRYFSSEAGDRLLLVNLGAQLHFTPAPEPLLAPMEGQGWTLAWSSEAPEYEGNGTAPVETKNGWVLPAESVVWLTPHANDALTDDRA